MSHRRVAILGDLNIDMLVKLPAHSQGSPPELRMLGGGAAANTAVGIARLGRDVRFAGTVGDDLYGRFLIDELRTEGVDTEYIRADPDHFTVTVFAFIDDHGERHNVTWPSSGGAHFQVRSESISNHLLEGVDWVHVTGINLGESPLRETTLSFMQEARRFSIPVSIDLNLRLEFFGWRPGVRESVRKAMDLSDYIFGSYEEEMGPLSGLEDSDEILSWIAGSESTVIARRGKHGLFTYSKRGGMGRQFFPSYRVSVQDTLGAGDAFNAGFIASMLEENGFQESVTQGHACAGYKLTGSGARNLPTREQLDRFMSETSFYPEQSTGSEENAGRDP